MEDRPAFTKMIRNIASGRVRAVIVANVDRFFRRKWNDEAEKFMQICDTYGVKVIVPNPWRTGIDFVYDFSAKGHIEQFRRKCEEAWNYLESHIYGRMLAAQDELGRAGFWAGGNLPIGYIVDRREKIDGKRNPKYRMYIPYEPHARIVRWLFDRYWELGGQVMALLEEIERLEYLFPAFDESVDEEIVPKIVYLKVLNEDGSIKGYRLKSDKGLRSLLSNPAYIGYWIYKEELISTDNHEPIVDFVKFSYAFNRISTVHLDGSPNGAVLERQMRYVKKHIADRPAILKNHITASNPAQRINICTTPVESRDAQNGHAPRVVHFYGFYKRGASSHKSVKYMISCADLDGIFLDHFIQRLQNANEFDNFLDKEDAEQAAQAQLQTDIDEQIKAVKLLLTKIENQVATGVLTDPDLVKAAQDGYKLHKEELTRLRNRKEQTAQYITQAQMRRTYQQMMREAGQCWHEVVSPDEMPMLVDTFIDKVVIDPATSHFYKMHIHWSDPEWGTDELVCYRDSNASVLWTDNELALLTEHYETVSREELLQMFPTRAYTSVVFQATKLGMSRPRHGRTENIPRTFCLLDWRIMQQYGVTEEQLRATKGGRLIQWEK